MSIIFEILGTWLVVLLVPGQDMALIIRTTVAHSRREAMRMVVGICTALSIHLVLACSSLGVLISHSPSLMSSVQKVGAVYIGYLGVSFLLKALLTRKNPAASDFFEGEVTARLSAFQAARVGFLSTILNPKVLVFFFGLFAGFLKNDTPITPLVVAALMILLSVYSFYAALTFMISAPGILDRLKRNLFVVEAFSGAALVGVAIHLLVNHF